MSAPERICDQCGLPSPDADPFCFCRKRMTVEEWRVSPARIGHLRTGDLMEDAAINAILNPMPVTTPPAIDPKVTAIVEALRGMIYETTSLSPEEADGSHWCRISKAALSRSRAAIAAWEAQ